MLLYVNEKAVCRSRIIGNYFGDSGIGSCGICDNCLAQKRKNFTKEEFENLYNEISSSVEKSDMGVNELLQKTGQS